MKKLLFLFSFLFVLSSCDDGDVEIETINFEDVQPQKCSETNLLFKINQTDALLFNIENFSTFNDAFLNDITLVNAPRTIAISSTSNKVIYRSYDGVVAATKFCGTITDANPAVVEEWNAVSGTATVTTTAIKSINTDNGVEKISKYNHLIEFKNITFQKPVGVQIYETLSFGNYQTTPVNLPFAFAVNELVKSNCSDTDTRLLNIKGSEVLQLNLDAATYANLIQSSPTTTPRTALLDNTNTLFYKLFNTAITNSYFCVTPSPANPVLVQEWIAKNGVTNVSGLIEVSTTTFGVQYIHTVHLRNVTFTRGNSDFKLGDDYVLGSFFTN